MTQTPLDIRRAVVFAILMNNHEGILGKAPSYVEEKWRAVHEHSEPEALLDHVNMDLFIDWEIKWTDQQER